MVIYPFTTEEGTKIILNKSKVRGTPPKFNSSPLKSYRAIIGRDGVPTTIFEVRTVQLWGCNFFLTPVSGVWAHFEA